MAAITIIMPDDLRTILGALAERNQRSVGAEVRYRIELTLAEEKQKEALELAKTLKEARG